MLDSSTRGKLFPRLLRCSGFSVPLSSALRGACAFSASSLLGRPACSSAAIGVSFRPRSEQVPEAFSVLCGAGFWDPDHCLIIGLIFIPAAPPAVPRVRLQLWCQTPGVTGGGHVRLAPEVGFPGHLLFCWIPSVMSPFLLVNSFSRNGKIVSLWRHQPGGPSAELPWPEAAAQGRKGRHRDPPWTRRARPHTPQRERGAESRPTTSEYKRENAK